MDFIDKNVNEELFNQKIFDTLNYAKTNFSTKKEGLFIFENRFSRIRLSYDEIYFVETSETVHKLILHGKYDYMEFYGTIAEIAEKTDLVRCHRSFAINPQNMTRVDKVEGLVYFPNGEQCSVSKKNLKKITQLMSNQKSGVR